jgi:hypothetical protein
MEGQRQQGGVTAGNRCGRSRIHSSHSPLLRRRLETVGRPSVRATLLFSFTKKQEGFHEGHAPILQSDAIEIHQ